MELTRDEILKMEADKGTDALCAENIMKWKFHDGRNTAGPSYWVDSKGGYVHQCDFEPSLNSEHTDIVRDKIKSMFNYVCIDQLHDSDGEHCVIHTIRNHYVANAETWNLALIRAALLAVMEK